MPELPPTREGADKGGVMTTTPEVDRLRDEIARLKVILEIVEGGIMACDRCGSREGPGFEISAAVKAWKEDTPRMVDVRELKATLCLECARDLKAWLTSLRTGKTEGG